MVCCNRHIQPETSGINYSLCLRRKGTGRITSHYENFGCKILQESTLLIPGVKADSTLMDSLQIPILSRLFRNYQKILEPCCNFFYFRLSLSKRIIIYEKITLHYFFSLYYSFIMFRRTFGFREFMPSFGMLMPRKNT
jgi:hypothetical protein